VVRVGPDVTDQGLEALVLNGLDKKAPDACRAWLAAREDVRTTQSAARAASFTRIDEQLEVGKEELSVLLRAQILPHIVALYPSVIWTRSARNLSKNPAVSL